MNVRDSTGKTALHCAVSVSTRGAGKSSDLIQLLVDAGADVNAAYKVGETPFYVACFKGLESVAKKMLEYGAKVGGISGKKLPLHAACRNKHVSVVQLLLTNGANPNLQEEGCDSRYRRSFPLHIAAAGHNSKLTKFLLKHGADVDVTDINGNTALHHAVKYYSPRQSWSQYSEHSRSAKSVVDILLKKKADVNIVNNSGDTPLYLAASKGLLDVVDKGNVDMTRSLLKAGADVHAVNSEGKSIVSFATEIILNRSCYRCKADTRNKLSIVHLLLQRGADVNMMMPHVDSPLYAAVNTLADVRRWGHQYATAVIQLLQLMVKYGAKLQDSCYQTGNSVYFQAWPLMSLITFNVKHDFIVEWFRAGLGFQLLARCCDAVATRSRRAKFIYSISLCQAAVIAGYVPSDEELQQLQLAAVGDHSADHLIQQLVNWLNEDRQQVPSLQRQCRVVIRRQLSVAGHFQSILPAIEQLHLPNVIKEYLRFDGPLTEVDLGVYRPTRP